MAVPESDTLRDTLLELRSGLAESQQRAEQAKVDWNQAIESLRARTNAISALETLLEASAASNGSQPATQLETRGSAEITLKSGRAVLLDVMQKEPNRTWTLDGLVKTYAERRLSLHLSDPTGAIKNQVNRLIADGVVLRIKPGVYRLAAR